MEKWFLTVGQILMIFSADPHMKFRFRWNGKKISPIARLRARNFCITILAQMWCGFYLCFCFHLGAFEVEVRICVRPNLPITNLILLTAIHKLARLTGPNTRQWYLVSLKKVKAPLATAPCSIRGHILEQLQSLFFQITASIPFFSKLFVILICPFLSFCSFEIRAKAQGQKGKRAKGQKGQKRQKRQKRQKGQK